MGARNPLRRGVGIVVGTVVILVVGLYGPATLVGPLPEAQAKVTTPSTAPQASAPVLPEDGASAVTVAADKPAIAAAGVKDAVPLAGVTKLVTALVVLDARPIAAGRDGALIRMTAADVGFYAAHRAAGDVTVPVVLGETWSEKQMLQAMLLASSNNHADSLVRWAFGSENAYLDAAKTWLAKNGMNTTAVADASGISENSVGTAADAAHLAALAMHNATIADIIAHPVNTLAGGRVIENNTSFHPELGVTGISRSYTDAAGVCFLFAATVKVNDKPFTFTGAFLRMPDWDTLQTALTALMTDARASVHQITLVKKGASFATITSAWGDTAHAVADEAVTITGWSSAQPRYAVRLRPVTVASKGHTIGEVELRGATAATISLTLDRTLSDPGVGWRVSHPIPVISTFVKSLGG